MVSPLCRETPEYDLDGIALSRCFMLVSVGAIHWVLKCFPELSLVRTYLRNDPSASRRLRWKFSWVLFFFFMTFGPMSLLHRLLSALAVT
jgi:hypothetical protein